MASRPTLTKITFDEYLDLEEYAKHKSEYRSGEVCAMSGGTPIHSQLQVNVFSLLRQHKSKDCRIYSSELKVFAPAVNEGMYPDASMVRGDLEYYGKRNDVIMNPVLVIEVLSPSTHEYDLSLKAEFYRTIPSLSALLFVDSERRWIQRQLRPENEWKLAEFTEPDQIALFISGVQIKVADIYEDIIFSS